MQGATFVPASISIFTGDIVIWTNDDALSHTATSGNPCSSNGTFNSGLVGPGDSFQFTFTNAGDFNYFCALHCLGGMVGDVSVVQPTDVDAPSKVATLSQNFPNPFNPRTTIAYSLTERARAVVSIFDSEGALVIRMDQGVREAGTYQVEWDGRNASGATVGSGVYFYRLEGVPGVMPRKMVLLK
jgi:hypothetical protein